MSLQEVNPTSYPTAPNSPVLNRDARDAANRWLAQFAPLLDDTEMSAELCRQRLRSVPTLRTEGKDALDRLSRQACQDDLTLLDTLRQAIGELEPRELELRHRLALLAPGDAEAGVDLVGMRDKLAHNAARRELAEATGTILDYPAILELKTSPPNWASAGFMGVFGIGWLSFTSIHAYFFIGGFLHAIGFLALGFLAFYAIFFLAGAAMLTGAVRAACTEELSLSGRELVIRRKLGAYEGRKSYTVSPESRAYLSFPNNNRPGTPVASSAAFTDADGREIAFASGRPQHELERLVERLNAYLTVLR